MIISRRQFLVLSAVEAGMLLAGCGSAPKKPETLEKVVEETPTEKPAKPAVEEEDFTNLTEEQKLAKWFDYIDEVKKEMPKEFTGAEQLEYKGKIYAVLLNVSNEMDSLDFKYLFELERVYGSLEKLGVEKDNIAVLYDSKKTEAEAGFNEVQKHKAEEARKTAEAIGALDATVENLDKVFDEYEKIFTDDDILIFYVTGCNKVKDIEASAMDKELLKKGGMDHVLLFNYMKPLRDADGTVKVKGKRITFLGHPGYGLFGMRIRHIDDIAAVNAAGLRKDYTITYNYSFLSTVAEAAARGASVEQAVDYARNEQQKILEYGQKLGLVEHTDEGANICTKAGEKPDFLTKKLKK